MGREITSREIGVAAEFDILIALIEVTDTHPEYMLKTKQCGPMVVLILQQTCAHKFQKSCCIRKSVQA